MAAIIPYLFESVYRSTLCPSCILPNACFCSFDFASAFGYGSIVTAPRKNSAATVAGIVRFRLAIIVSSDYLVRTTLAPIGCKEIAECAVCDPHITVRPAEKFGPPRKEGARRRAILQKWDQCPIRARNQNRLVNVFLRFILRAAASVKRTCRIAATRI